MQSLATAINGASQARQWCFPCSIARCCPCLPSSWTKIQDWLHLVLVIGVLASLLCLIQIVYELGFGDSCYSPLCFKQWVSGLVVLPTTVYFIQTIGSYDEQLREKKQRHEQEVERLIGSINEQVAEMNELCRNVTDNANNFATGRFNDKSQAFKLFLHQVKETYADLYVGPEMLEQLKRFIIAWFQAFSGTVINPRDSPLMSGVERELGRCTTLQALCDQAMKRLEGTAVAFKFQMPADTPMLRNRTIEDGSASGSFHSSSSFSASVTAEGQGPRNLCGVSWLRCGRCGGCGAEPRRCTVPITLSMGCAEIKILSRSHGNLLFAFLADIFLLFFELFSDRWAALILVVWNQVCIISMLACFEQINEIAQLEQQIHIYVQRNDEVGRRRDEARNSWEKVQQLHDLWLYRTLPTLSIMGKVHTKLGLLDMECHRAAVAGRAEEDPRLEFLQHANECLNCLQLKLGPLEDWRNAKEPLAEQWKESIGRQLRDCEGEELELVLNKLPIINTDLRSIEAPLPTAALNSARSSRSSASGPAR